MAASRTVGAYPAAKRSLGQNFLTDENTARKIVAALELTDEDRVLEIGPGRGALTRWLAPASRVLCLEKDRDLAGRLKEHHPGISVINADAMDFGWERLDRRPGIKLVGNLPYNVASPLLWEIVSRCSGFERGVFMVQWEVAGRIAAPPGSRVYGGLSVWLQNHAVVRPLFKVGPNVFHPRPKVDSGVVLFSPLPKDDRPENAAALAALVRLCFQKRRKQLGTILSPLGAGVGRKALESVGIPEKSRPEQVSPRDFRRLSEELSTFLRS